MTFATQWPKFQPNNTLSNWIDIPAGEELMVKPGAMLAMKNLTVNTRIANHCCKRLWCGGSAVMNAFEAGPKGGQILLETDRLGQLVSEILSPERGMILQPGACIAHTSNINLQPHIQMAGWLSGLGPAYMKADVNTKEEKGTIYFKTRSGVTQKIEVTENQSVIIDNTNLVGYTDGLTKTVQKIGGFITTLFGGEGLVCEFTGNGTVYVGSNAHFSGD